MLRTRRSLCFWAILVVGPVWATAAERDAKSARALAITLERETRENIPDRAALLEPLFADAAVGPQARWAAGFVRTGKGWAHFEAAPPAADAETLDEYRQRRANGQFNAAAHVALANWCREHKLFEQERAHLLAALSDQPNQPALWQRLGYKQVDGRWLTPEDERAVERRWQQRQQDLQRWRPKAANLQQRLKDASPAVQAAARKDLLALDDVSAGPALEEALAPESPESALDLVAWLKRTEHTTTTLALARQAVLSPWENVRNMATDALCARKLEDYAPALLDTLSGPVSHKGKPIDPRMAQWLPTLWSRGVMVLPGSVVGLQIFRRELHDHVDVLVRRTVAGNAIPVVEATIPRSVSAIPGAREQRAARSRNDLARFNADRQFAASVAVEGANRTIGSLNDRVDRVLNTVTGYRPDQAVPGWWDWWDQYSAVEPTGAKTLNRFSEIEGSIPQPVGIQLIPWGGGSVNTSCLPAGALVSTAEGLRPIETLQIGDLVLAKDIDTGEVALRPVLKTTVRTPQPLVNMDLGDETLQATQGHHFWISGKGWVKARDLRPGDRFHGLTGTVTLSAITSGETAAVYNLVVDRASTYFVGRSLILSHDVTPPSPTDVKVPGLAAR